MKKFLIGVSLLLFFLCSSCAIAGGGVAHMFLAKEVIAKLPDPALRTILEDNFDDYLVGAYYPDSGYVMGNLYGEDSHWDPFIYAFAEYIKETYPNAAEQNPKLVAFLFGCASHRVSDEIQHRTFYPIMSEKDFNGNRAEAHEYGDTGIDLLALLEKNLWQNEPSVWRVPVKDLVQVYQRMGKPEYTEEQIIRGNQLISVAGFAERVIAVPAYPILMMRMPWTAAHYYDWPQGGQVMIEDKIVDYQMNLWKRLQNKSTQLPIARKPDQTKSLTNLSTDNAEFKFAESALQSGAVTVSVNTNQDGSVDIGKPSITDSRVLQDLINELSQALMK